MHIYVYMQALFYRLYDHICIIVKSIFVFCGRFLKFVQTFLCLYQQFFYLIDFGCNAHVNDFLNECCGVCSVKSIENLEIFEI